MSERRTKSGRSSSFSWRLGLLLLAGLAALLWAAAQAQEVPSTPPLRFYGTLTAGDDVVLHDQTGDEIGSAMTDELGHWFIDVMNRPSFEGLKFMVNGEAREYTVDRRDEDQALITFGAVLSQEPLQPEEAVPAEDDSMMQEEEAADDSLSEDSMMEETDDSDDLMFEEEQPADDDLMMEEELEEAGDDLLEEEAGMTDGDGAASDDAAMSGADGGMSDEDGAMQADPGADDEVVYPASGTGGLASTKGASTEALAGALAVVLASAVVLTVGAVRGRRMQA